MIILILASQNMRQSNLTKLSVTESMAAFDFQTKSFVIWEPSVLWSRFLFNIIRDTSAFVIRIFFFNMQSPTINWPRDPPWGSWNIVMDKILFTNSLRELYMVQIQIKYDQISPCISNYEIKSFFQNTFSAISFTRECLFTMME